MKGRHVPFFIGGMAFMAVLLIALATVASAAPAAAPRGGSAPTATPTVAPTPIPVGPDWSNLGSSQVWMDPVGSVHIEFVAADPAATNYRIGVHGGKALTAFVAMGGDVADCQYYTGGKRTPPKLSCSSKTLELAVADNGDGTWTVSTPEFVGSPISFGELDDLIGSPDPGFFLVWETNEELNGIYVP